MQVFRKVFLLVLGVGWVAWGWGQGARLVVPVGHSAGIWSVAFSPDRKYILTGSGLGDKTAKLWDMSGREIQTFSGHVDVIYSVTFSPDGKTVLTGSADGTAKLWALDGHMLRTFKGHAKAIWSVTFSPDGKKILTGSKDKTMKMWDLYGRTLRTFKGHTADIWSVAFSPDGKRMLTGSKDKTVKLWDLDGHIIQTFKGHAADIWSVAFSPNEEIMLTGSADGTAKLWDLDGHALQTFATSTLISPLNGKLDNCFSVTFAPDGKKILTSYNNNAKLWDLSGQEIQTFSGHVGVVYSVTFSPDGSRVLTGGSDGTAKLWNLNGQIVRTFKGHSEDINSLLVSPNGKILLISGGNGMVKVWDLNGSKIKTFIGDTVGIQSVAFSPDGEKIVTANYDRNARLWDLNGHLLQTFVGNSAEISSVAFSSDGKILLTGHLNQTVKLWDLSGQEIKTFSDHAHFLFFNRRGMRFIKGFILRLGKYMEIERRKLRMASAHGFGFTSVDFSPDGKLVLTGGMGMDGKLWDLDGHEIQTFSDHGAFIYSIIFSPDGKKVLMGCWDSTAKLWDINGRKLKTFAGHSDLINSVDFSPACPTDPLGGKMVLTGSWDNTAKLWDLSGREIRTFLGHTGSIISAVFFPDGKHILTGSADHTARLWDVASGEQLAALTSLDSTDWVVATPSGLFDASPGAMKLMYYVQGLEVIELDQLKERYYEPGLLAKILGSDKSELRNVANFDQVALYPEIKASIEKAQLTIHLTERSGGLGKLSLFINDKEVQEDINPQRLKTLNLDLQAFTKYYQTDTINSIALRAYNQEGWLKSQAYELTYRPAHSPGVKTIPHLYALVVGTSNYSGEKLDLRFADQDAAAMSQALRDAGSALFGADHTSVHLLTSTLPAEPCAKTNIHQAFADLAAKATPADVLVVYFSGHGLAYGEAEKAQFYYLTKDIGSEDLSDPEVRNNFTISSNEFTQWLTAIPAQKQVMILDACNAGKVAESLAALAQKNLDPSQIRALDRMKDRTGMFILTGSAADKVSYEASQYGQGLLTYSLLQGMSGLALTEDKRVDVMTLFQYARDKVPELAKGIGGVQTPVLAFPAGGASFDIGIVHAGVKIPVAVGKPVFIRNVFQDEVSFDDALGLTDALEKYFREITAKGAQAALIYVDVKEYENAYSMKGLYNVTGEVVVVRGRLFRGKEPKGEFQVSGKKSDLPGLVEGIVQKVTGLLK